jgi:Rrf2 family protein
MISKKCEYGIQAILYLSILEKNQAIPVGQIAKKLQLPKEFVSKILQSLTDYGIIGSIKGKNGGFYLLKNSKEITILDIIKIIDGEKFLDGCVLGFDNCSDEKPCPVHIKWKKCKNQIIEIFSKETIDKYELIIREKINL